MRDDLAHISLVQASDSAARLLAVKQARRSKATALHSVHISTGGGGGVVHAADSLTWS
jgi:hypothetical protein